MTAPTGIETEAYDRVRALFKASPTFQAWIGANVNPDTRIHEDEVIENLDPLAPRTLVRPLVLIEGPSFYYVPAGLVEYDTQGGITALIESQYLGEINDLQGQAMRREFRATIGQIRRELMALRNDPLGTSPYVYFHSITTVMPPTRTLFDNRGPGNDFFAVQWKFSLMNEGGE
jgi:hypothetical protein